MTNKIRRRRRCVLAVPGSSERKIEKAMGSGIEMGGKDDSMWMPIPLGVGRIVGDETLPTT